jgi:hypothetical protein
MNDMDPRLIGGESVVFTTTKHWAAPVVDSRWAILMVLGAFALGWIQPDSGGGLLGLISRAIDLVRLSLYYGGIAWIIYNFVAWHTAEFAVTNQRVFCQEGLVHRRASDTLLTSLSDVRTSMSSVGRALGYGTIRLISSSGVAGEDRFTTVRNVEAFKIQILEQKARSGPVHAETSARDSVGRPPQPVGSTVTALDTIEVLERLVKLKDAGAITPEEYDAKKAQFLNRLS